MYRFISLIYLFDFHKDIKKNGYSLFLTLLTAILSSFLFSLGLSHESIIIQNVAGMFFTTILFFWLCFYTTIDQLTSTRFFILANYSVLCISFYLFSIYFNVNQSSFWVPDSIATHLPESLKLTNWNSFFSLQSILDFFSKPGRTTHLLTGISLKIFGVNYFATGVVQLFFKLVSAVFIYRCAKYLWNEKVGKTAMIIYLFCPTVFFYTNVLYKESAVHMLVSITLYCLVRIQQRKINCKILILFFVSNLALYNERSYLVSLYAIALLGVLLSRYFSYKKSLLFFSIILTFGLLAYYFFLNSSFNLFWKEIISLRTYHASFGDIANQINYHIPYPIAFLKTLFSPYFTFNKFNVFVGFSNILIWGSFINQIIILFALGGFLSNIKKSIIHLYIWLPLIIFLLFAAYISPWSGRIRDSFYPMLSCYAAFFFCNNNYINSFFERYRLKQMKIWHHLKSV